MSREITSTLDTVAVMPVRQYQRTGAGGAIRSVIRAIPVAVLRPTAGAAEALSYTLLGLRNNIDPSVRLDEEDMWNVDHSAMTGRDGNTRSSTLSSNEGGGSSSRRRKR